MVQAKAYHLWYGKHKFFCNGRIMSGQNLHRPDFYRAILTFSMILFPSLILLITVGPQLIQTSIWGIFIHLLLYTFSLIFLIKTSLTNPGIIPKQEYPFAQVPLSSPTLSQALRNEPTKTCALDKGVMQVPLKGKLMKLKFCQTCLIVRPPRSSHCGDCDVCVQKFDHHCPWVGNCIGKYNYKFFQGFLYSTSALIVWSLIILIQYIVLVFQDLKDDGYQGKQAFEKGLQICGVEMFLLMYIFFICWFVFGMTFFHTYLLVNNLTTRQVIKGEFRYEKWNPFKRSLTINCKGLCVKEPVQMRPRFNQIVEDPFQPMIQPRSSQALYKRKQKSQWQEEEQALNKIIETPRHGKVNTLISI